MSPPPDEKPKDNPDHIEGWMDAGAGVVKPRKPAPKANAPDHIEGWMNAGAGMPKPMAQTPDAPAPDQPQPVPENEVVEVTPKTIAEPLNDESEIPPTDEDNREANEELMKEDEARHPPPDPDAAPLPPKKEKEPEREPEATPEPSNDERRLPRESGLTDTDSDMPSWEKKVIADPGRDDQPADPESPKETDRTKDFPIIDPARDDQAAGSAEPLPQDSEEMKLIKENIDPAKDPLPDGVQTKDSAPKAPQLDPEGPITKQRDDNDQTHKPQGGGGGGGPAAFPSRAIKIVVPFAQGSTVDMAARIIASKLNAAWKETTYVECKPGANGSIGASYVAKADPDGYTLLFSSPNPLALNQSLYARLDYQPGDFAMTTMVASIPLLMFVNRDSRISSLKELIETVRQNPKEFTIGYTGKGTISHLTAVAFITATGSQMIQVDKRTLGDLISDRVDLMFGDVYAALPYARDSKISVVATLGRSRALSLPNIPTAIESGLPELVSTNWLAIGGPSGMRAAISNQIASKVSEVLKLSDVRDSLRSIGADPVGGTPQEAKSFVQDEAARWGNVIKRNGISLD